MTNCAAFDCVILSRQMMPAEQHGSATDAYRIFFPLGILLGVAGVAIWPLYYFGATSGYSGRSHMFVQAECFLDFSHLAWAALFWICGIVFWGIYLCRHTNESVT